MNNNACGGTNVDGAAMPDPAGAFIFAETPQLCAKLCDRAGKLCRVYVNDAFACYRRVFTDFHTFGKLNCETIEELPADVKVCKGELNDQFVDGSVILKSQRDSELEDCLAWRDACRAACLAP